MHFPSLLEMAKAEGLELVLFTGLHKFYADVLHGKSLSDLSGAPVAVRCPLLLLRILRFADVRGCAVQS